MKAKMYSQHSNTLLHDHIIDGFHTTHEGLHQLKEQKLINEKEYTDLLEMNIKRLVDRIHEFRVQEALIEAGKRALCIFFAIIFMYMQVQGDELDMRRPVRSGRAASRTGRRRSEGEFKADV